MIKAVIPVQRILPFVAALLVAVSMQFGSAAVVVAEGLPQQDAFSGPEGKTSARIKAERYVRKGMALQKNNQTEEALKKYLRALEADPTCEAASWEIGWSYWKLERWQDVVDSWQRVVDMRPNYKDGEARTWLKTAKANLRTSTASTEALDAHGPDAVPAKDGEKLRFAVAGDTMLGSPLSRAGLPKNGGANLLDAYREHMKAADISFLNLEGVLKDGGKSRKCGSGSKACYAFRSPTSYVSNLVAAGVDVVSIANNHANDFGSAGVESTRTALTEAGVSYSGPSGHETILERNGVKIGVLAFSTSPGQNDLRRIESAKVLVKELAEKSDLVVVSFHGGAEGTKARHTPHGKEKFYGEDRGNLRDFTHAVVDSGADLVVGHGPHVLRGMEVYRDRLIFYSLGNFCTYGGFNLRGSLGVTALALVDLHPDGRFAGGKLVPGRQLGGGGPVLDPDNKAISELQELSAADFGERAPTILNDGTVQWTGAKSK